MRYRGIFTLTAVILIIIVTSKFFMDSFHAHEKAKEVIGFYQIHNIFISEPKCSLSKPCPPDSFAFSIHSGAATVVGPKICFDGKNIMSHILNNVGPGLNIVVINDTNGVIEKYGYLNMITGDSGQILAYLKDIKPGMIVLVASYDDATTKMTDEIRETFVAMGSTLIGSLNHRDNWVFAGRAGTKIKSFYEKLLVSDEKTNVFDGWPGMVKVGGCFPRTVDDT
ncbi:protein FAM3C isoform X2 [Nothobranchius furzeri]|uniref:protein FAM3C isoform X2 n=1 Tax=Nothobranchius furzeri TaxID=105023 RepID=UPI00240469EF|nr:protein FAM3C isoform X2 [Nothobranchius furzeri]